MPKILILDEPTSALDSKTASNLLNNLKRFAQQNEITQIIISHDLTLVKEFGDDVISCFHEMTFQEAAYE
jgi:putative ABC transport system ATP-binding protein